MSARYPVPAARHRVEEEIRRSRFITTVRRAPDPEAARRFVAEISAEFADATHHCWAYVAGPPGDTARIGMSDDGEPRGTAGRPMLAQLLHGGVGEIVAVVTRYYGGVKLGRGGLGRAYSSGVQRALETLPLASRIHVRTRLLRLEYADVDPVFRLLDELGVRRLEEDFSGEVRLRLGIPDDRLETLDRRLAELTGGRAELTDPADDAASPDGPRSDDD